METAVQLQLILRLATDEEDWSYMLVHLNEDLLETIMSRMERCSEEQDDDPELSESKYWLEGVTLFRPTSQKLTKRLEKLLEDSSHAFLYSNLVKPPKHACAKLTCATMTADCDQVRFCAMDKDGNEYYSESLDGGAFEIASEILSHNEKVSKKKEDEDPDEDETPKPAPKSYFS